MTDLSRTMLDLAARIAIRAQGYVEPNPLVGCVLARGARVIGMGHHRIFGGLHAEAAALEDCRARNESTAGATAYVTLEPCAHIGKQPPCVEALINAGVSRVVCARRDPNPVAMGGAELLQAAGVIVEFTAVSRAAIALSDPFVKRVTTGLPFVIAKWAQTIDGWVGTRTGESKWISSDLSRSRVHRVRARVDAIITGIGTVLADDPALTARGGWTRRRTARRVIIDPDLEVSDQSQLMRSIDEAPITLVCTDNALLQKSADVSVLAARGVEIVSLGSGDEVDVTAVLQHLAQTHDATNVLVEAGPGLMGRLFDADLVDEAMVFIAPIILGDEQARPAARGRLAESLSDGRRYRLESLKRIQNDALLTYRRL